jgi:hypothetical protein
MNVRFDCIFRAPAFQFIHQWMDEWLNSISNSLGHVGQSNQSINPLINFHLLPLDFAGFACLPATFARRRDFCFETTNPSLTLYFSLNSES